MGVSRSESGEGGSPRTLYALNLTGGAIERIDPHTGQAATIAAGLREALDGIVVDERAGTITFTFMGVPDGWAAALADLPPDSPPASAAAAITNAGEPTFFERTGSVQRVPLAGLEGGEQPEVIVPWGVFVTGKQLTSDPTSRRLYWADREGRGVWRSEADGSDPVRVISTAGRLGGAHASSDEGQQEWCVGVAVDSENGYLYWSQKGPSKGGAGRILRAGLSIPGGETDLTRTDIEVLWEHLPEPIDLEIDRAAGYLYWTDRGAEPDGNSLNCAPVPAPGYSGERPTVLARGFREAIGLALDIPGRQAYVSDLSGEIRVVDLETRASRILTTLSGAATGLALSGD